MIDKHIISKIEKAISCYLKTREVNEFFDQLPIPMTRAQGIEVLNILKRQLSHVEKFELGVKLVAKWNKKSRKIGNNLLIGYWKSHPMKAREFLLKFANDPDWSKRESAACVLSSILTHDFDNSLPWFTRLVCDSNSNIRRAVVVAVKYSVQERIPGRAKILLDLITPLLADKTEYVRKNLGAFAIGDGFLRVYPKETLDWIKHQIINTDLQTRWNLAKIFASSGGNNSWPQGEVFLKTLATDERHYVWRAVSSSLVYLGRKRPDEINVLLKDWQKDPKRKYVAKEALKYLFGKQG